jgi:hypothetical protein
MLMRIPISGVVNHEMDRIVAVGQESAMVRMIYHRCGKKKSRHIPSRDCEVAQQEQPSKTQQPLSFSRHHFQSTLEFSIP